MYIIILSLLIPCLALAEKYPITHDVIGENVVLEISHDQSWNKLAIAHEISVSDLKNANKDASKLQLLKKGHKVIIPKQYILPHASLRTGIVLNMAEQRLYYFPKDTNIVYTYPVAMGKKGWRTPTGKTKIVKKTMHPTWHVPESIREHSLDTHGYLLPDIVLPGPRNPLGSRAISLGFNGILIHGTNNQSSIGKLASSGCIRMHNHNVEELFEMVDLDTPVTIINHSVKVGYDKNANIVLEVHKDVSHDDVIITEYNRVDLYDLLTKSSQIKIDNLNWDKAAEALDSKNGIPTLIS